MKTKLLFLLALCCFAFTTAFAQKRVVKGTVLSQSDGEPMIGVAIAEKGTTNGTITDADGNFSINIAEEAILVVSYVGYTTQNVKPVGNAPIKIELVEDSQLLEDVVVVGYGTMRKSDISGSVATVNREQMMKKAPTNIGQALQGAAAGVMVTAQDGAPDANQAIRIRGIGTIDNGADPLYVVDGVQVGTSANFINPADIESIEVLKDASATAIYGSKGANGVIMITTKHGGKGKSNVQVTMDLGVQQLPYKIETLGMKDFVASMRAALATDKQYGTVDFENKLWNKDASQINYIDWQDQMTRAAVKQQYGVSASGGNDKGSYNFSVGYLNHDGLIVATNYNRLTARANAKVKVNSYLEVGGDMNFVHSESSGSNRGINNNGNLSSHRDLAFMTPTLDYLDDNGNIVNVNVVNSDGSYGAMNATNTPQGWEGNTLIMQNVYASQKEGAKEGRSRNNRVSVSGFADLALLNMGQHKLNVHTIASYTHWANDGDSFGGNHVRKNNGVEFPANGDQLYNFSINQSQGSSLSNETYMTYKWDTDFNNLTVMGGFSASKDEGGWVNASAKDFLAPTMRQTGLARDQDSKKGSGGLNADVTTISYYARAIYSLMDKYILTATIRKDGSSNFSEGNRWGTFPSAALAWRVKEESFLKDVDQISNLKLRFGWGQTGNAGSIGGKSVASLSQTTYYFYGNGRPMGLGSDHKNQVSALYGPLVDKNLKWETNEQTNVGIDLGLMNNDLSITLDYFIRTTSDLLVNRTMRSSSGWTSIYTNFGEIKNSGLEFSVNYNKQLTKDWSINVTFNGSTLKNEITKMELPIYAQATGGNDGSTLDGSNVQAVDGGSHWDNHSLSQQGSVIGSYYGWKVDKIYGSQSEVDADNATAKANSDGSVNYRQEENTGAGDYRFKDLNNDGIIDDQDRTIIGNGLPKFNYGLNIGATYKNWDFTLYMYGVLGQDILSYSAMRLSSLYVSDDNTAANILKDSWKEIQSGKLPRATFKDYNHNVRISDAWVKNGNFLRISNLQVGYNLPKNLLKPCQISNARVYASIQNLALFSPYKKYGDPEVGQGSVLFSGLDTGRYPTPRTYMFGLNVTF